MKKLSVILLASGFITCASVSVVAEETAGEKLEVVGNDAKLKNNQISKRAMEKICAKSDLKCISEKSKNRVIQVKDAASDDTKNLKSQGD